VQKTWLYICRYWGNTWSREHDVYVHPSWVNIYLRARWRARPDAKTRRVSSKSRISSVETAGIVRTAGTRHPSAELRSKRAFTLRRKVNFHSCSRRVAHFHPLHLTTSGYRRSMRVPGGRLKIIIKP